jgi:hypothetical protein
VDGAKGHGFVAEQNPDGHEHDSGEHPARKQAPGTRCEIKRV